MNSLDLRLISPDKKVDNIQIAQQIDRTVFSIWCGYFILGQVSLIIRLLGMVQF